MFMESRLIVDSKALEAATAFSLTPSWDIKAEAEAEAAARLHKMT